MTKIRLYNTKTRTKEAFTPLDPQNVRMYVCGPTVYDRAHIGNARPVIVFDVLYRLLRHVYGAEHVTYARNFTDVDDKINARAEASGRSIREITDETIAWYLEDMAALGNLEPDEAPRATEYIAEMVAMTEELIASGHAYEAEGHVLFDVTSYDRYGSLSGRSIDDMIAGARVEVAPYKRNPMDFVLWKPSADDLPGWDSPWGRGRPGWHIECSAMTRALFGERFDIHGGGLDLAFPHHENEKAQSCCEAGEDSFAQVWMHNEMLQVEGRKMSKSLGNFFSVRELLDQGYPGEVIRFVFLSTHYRKPMNWRQSYASIANMRLDIWSSEVASSDCIRQEFEGDPDGFVRAYVDNEVVDALCDDLNTSLATTHLTLLGKTLEGMSRAELSSDEVSSAHRRLVAGCELIGINLFKYWDETEAPSFDLEALAEKFSRIRAEAIATKDFSRVDAMKSLLVDAGVEVRMNKDGVELVSGPKFNFSKLEALK